MQKINFKLKKEYYYFSNIYIDYLYKCTMVDEQRRILGIIANHITTQNNLSKFYKERNISLDEFKNKTGLVKSRICRAIKNLILRNIIIKNKKGYISAYKINKKINEWKIN